MNKEKILSTLTDLFSTLDTLEWSLKRDDADQSSLWIDQAIEEMQDFINEFGARRTDDSRIGLNDLLTYFSRNRHLLNISGIARESGIKNLGNLITENKNARGVKITLRDEHAQPILNVLKRLNPNKC